MICSYRYILYKNEIIQYFVEKIEIFSTLLEIDVNPKHSNTQLLMFTAFPYTDLELNDGPR